jgi:Fur family ferric uptake transcriptional regulator
MTKSSQQKAEHLLARLLIKKTALRIQLVSLLLKEKKAFSQGDLIQELEKELGPVDRVSIYRNLNQLKRAGIIHEIESNKYVSCSHDCETHAHVLLYCEVCEKHNEIQDHKKLNLLFKAIGNLKFLSPNRALFLKGICEKCSG